MGRMGQGDQIECNHWLVCGSKWFRLAAPTIMDWPGQRGSKDHSGSNCRVVAIELINLRSNGQR